MSNAIQFLETLGRNPALIQGAAEAYALAVDQLEIAEAQRLALLDRDHAMLSELVDGRARMLCIICTPDDDEQEAVPDEDDTDGDGVPDDEPPPERK